MTGSQDALGGADPRSELILQHQPVGCLIVDGSTCVRFANAAAFTMLGVDRDRLVGQVFGLPLLPGEVTDVNVAGTDGSVRTLALRVTDLPGESGDRLVTLFDVTGRARRYEQEHRLVESLQRSLLLERLPDIDGVRLAARYLPGEDIVRVGGDWYDVIPLSDGRLAVAIGDVAGHGIESTALMSQLRSALRAYALEHESPAAVVQRLDDLLLQIEPDGMATLVYLVYDARTGSARFSAAGHPYPLLVTEDAGVRFLEGGRSLPLGVGMDGERSQGHVDLPPRSVLVLYTDGLVERRTRPLDDGLEGLASVVGRWREDPEVTCEAIVEHLLENDPQMDDAAFLVMSVLG